MKEILDNLKLDFEDYYDLLNYKKHDSVAITSRIDPSVVFVGSTISVLKPLLLNEQLDNNGVYLTQRAIRTRNLKRELIPEKNEWSSYFDATGVLVKYERLGQLVYDTIEFINKKLDIIYCDIMIRISSFDKDLANSLKNIDSNVKIEWDSRPEQYYRHKYGLDYLNIYGRNVNIAIRDFASKEYKDVGNLIVIESPDKKFGVENAIGLNALIMRKFGIDNSIDASSVVDIYPTKELCDYKFLDCLSVVSHLAYENVLETEKRSPEYLYKKYLKSLKYWANKKNIDNQELIDLIRNYLILEYQNVNEEYIEDNVTKQLIKIN